uniref:Chordin n=1 Tax=Plectus sambesii TaxID=2011161 RepID=A0A914VUM1_9BILA
MTARVLLAATLLALTCYACAAGARSRRRIPLIEEHERRPMTHTRRIGCHFGDDFHELMTEWHPHLDSPLPCFKCTCLPMRQNGRAAGRVSCKNFEDQCPEPTCDNPVTAADQCCKLCPDQAETDINIFGLNDEDRRGDEADANREFMALLSGRFGKKIVQTEGVGRAYITLREGSVHYSIHHERLEEPPTGVRFLDRKDTILYDLELDHSRDGKICGVWSEVPAYYLGALQRGHLSLVLTTKKLSNGAIGGVITGEKLLTFEALSSLLLPTPASGATSLGYGAVAVFNVHPGQHSLELYIRMRADMKSTTSYEVLLNFEKSDTGRRTNADHSIKLTLKNGFLSGNSSIKIGSLEQRWLSRGQLRISLSSPLMTPSEFSGLITLKKSCDIYQALLVRSDSKSAAGYAIVTPTNEMTLKYSLRILDVGDSDVSSLAVERERAKSKSKSKKTRTRGRNQMKPVLVNGRTRGYLPQRISARDAYQLFSEKLNFRVSASNHTLRGVLRRVLHSDAVSADGEPTLLRSADATALLWLGDSADCSLAYSLHMGDVSRSDSSILSICDTADYCPMKMDVTVRRSRNFFKSAMIEDVPFAARRLLSQGNAVAQLRVSGRKFVGDVHRMSAQCALRSLQRDSFTGYVSEDNELRNSIVSTDCRYENDTYKDGDTWHATHQPCTRCHCKRGASMCDAIVCPAVDCATPIQQPGECCPSCPLLQAVKGGCYWQGDDQIHQFGTTWHPYIPPYGFSTCVLCHCHPLTAEVMCNRKSCAALDCPLSEQIRENPADCCPVCVKPTAATQNKSCYFQRRHWKDGEEFSPEISHVAHLRCVRCKCTDGSVDCRRLGHC